MISNKQLTQWFNARSPVLRMRASALLALAYAFAIRANAAAAGTLPWERPMTAIATSLTGPVAYAIGLIGIAIAGGAMLWGGELTEFGRRACMSAWSYRFSSSQRPCCRALSA